MLKSIFYTATCMIAHKRCEFYRKQFVCEGQRDESKCFYHEYDSNNISIGEPHCSCPCSDVGNRFLHNCTSSECLPYADCFLDMYDDTLYKSNKERFKLFWGVLLYLIYKIYDKFELGE